MALGEQAMADQHERCGSVVQNVALHELAK